MIAEAKTSGLRAQASVRPASPPATVLALTPSSGAKERAQRRAAAPFTKSELPARGRVGGSLLFPLGLSFMNGPGSEHRAPCLLLSL